MLNKKEILREEKECAEMLGMTLNEYRKSVKKIEISTKKYKKNKNFDNSILSKLGLTEKDLKIRKV